MLRPGIRPGSPSATGETETVSVRAEIGFSFPATFQDATARERTVAFLEAALEREAKRRKSPLHYQIGVVKAER